MQQVFVRVALQFLLCCPFHIKSVPRDALSRYVNVAGTSLVIAVSCVAPWSRVIQGVSFRRQPNNCVSNCGTRIKSDAGSTRVIFFQSPLRHFS
jgi:hypothetical protein